MLDGAAPQDSLKDVGRTWPDVVHEHAQAGFVLSLVASLLVMLLVGTVFVVIAYRRAGREGRSFDAFGGWLFKLGAPAPPTDGDAAARPVGSGSTSTERPSSEVRPGDDPASPAARGALAIVRAALEIATAASDTVANDREGYLLTALFNSTTHHEGTTRRASILTIVDEPDGDRTMTVHQGFPERSFRRPYARFSSRAFDRDGAGLVLGCGPRLPRWTRGGLNQTKRISCPRCFEGNELRSDAWSPRVQVAPGRSDLGGRTAPWRDLSRFRANGPLRGGRPASHRDSSPCLGRRLARAGGRGNSSALTALKS